MTSTATAEGFSLSGTFNKLNHWRHILMDISMIGMAIGALVATGGKIAFLDPFVAWLKMHFAGLAPLMNGLPEFLHQAGASAGQGVWYTGADASMHAMHGGAQMAHPATHGAAGMAAYTATEQASLWSVDAAAHAATMSAHP